MQFIRNDAVKTAFITMMNKLVFGHREILRPLLDSLCRVDVAAAGQIEQIFQFYLKGDSLTTVAKSKGYSFPRRGQPDA